MYCKSSQHVAQAALMPALTLLSSFGKTLKSTNIQDWHKINPASKAGQLCISITLAKIQLPANVRNLLSSPLTASKHNESTITMPDVVLSLCLFAVSGQLRRFFILTAGRLLERVMFVLLYVHNMFLHHCRMLVA